MDRTKREIHRFGCVFRRQTSAKPRLLEVPGRKTSSFTSRHGPGDSQNDAKMGPEGLPKGSWRVLGAPGRPWSTDPKFLEHRPKLFGALGAVLAPLGALLAAFGAVLGPSWGLLGRSWDLPGRSWGSFWPPGGDFLALFLNALGKRRKH